MLKDYFTVQDVSKILNIYAVSAAELLDGVIDFEAEELITLSQHKGIPIHELLK